jgi:O-methyltransferase involved in polyketide biosynthesis
MNLPQVSRTAILTLITRVVASEKENTVYNDPMAVHCLEGLISVASAEEKDWIIGRKRFYGGISAHDAIAGARRARVFDDIANRYIAANPHCTVINLACGFDTRFWRIDHENCRYVEIDLPEVVALKREILIGCSVLDAAWIDQVTAHGSSHCLLLAEGLLMFLPQPDVIQLFQRLGQRFTHSQFAFDVVPEKYLKGLWKMLLRLETKINWRLDVSWFSGITDPGEVESYAPSLRVLGEARGSAGPIITVAIGE